MIRLALLLLGAGFIRSRWPVLAVIGALWAALGVAIFFDALDGDVWFPGASLRNSRCRRRCAAHQRRLGRALSRLAGLALDGRARAGLRGLHDRAVPDLLCRHGGLLRRNHIVPVWTRHAVACTAIAAAPGRCLACGAVCTQPADRRPGKRRAASAGFSSPDGGTEAALRARLDPGRLREGCPATAAGRSLRGRGRLQRGDLHRTRSAGSAAGRIHQPLPAEEIEHSPDDFRQLLRATEDNNVPGRFQPSYAIESAGWCESTAQVEFERYHGERLRAFWSLYRQDTTYNLTNRQLLEHRGGGARSGAGRHTRRQTPRFGAFLSALFNPELWVAAQLRRHAESMAWTPGLVLDYARSLRVAIKPPPLGLVTLTTVSANAVRGLRQRREFVARMRARAAAAKIAGSASAAKSLEKS